MTVTSETANPVSQFLPTLSHGGQTTRADTRKRHTGQRGASVSKWESKEFSLLEFTICIVTLKLQKRQKLKIKRFAAHKCSKKLFQVPTANGSPKTAQLCDQPATQAAVRNPASWLERPPPALPVRGAPRAPLSHWQKKNMSELITRQF